MILATRAIVKDIFSRIAGKIARVSFFRRIQVTADPEAEKAKLIEKLLQGPLKAEHSHLPLEACFCPYHSISTDGSKPVFAFSLRLNILFDLYSFGICDIPHFRLVLESMKAHNQNLAFKLGNFPFNFISEKGERIEMVTDCLCKEIQAVIDSYAAAAKSGT